MSKGQSRNRDDPSFCIGFGGIFCIGRIESSLLLRGERRDRRPPLKNKVTEYEAREDSPTWKATVAQSSVRIMG